MSTSIKKSVVFIGALLGIIFGNITSSMGFSIINTNLSLLNEYFNASLLDLQWIVNTYGIFVSSSLIIMGRIGDIFGKKRVYLIGLIAYILSMLGSGLAPSISWIIACQAVYGLSIGILIPLFIALIIDLFPHNKKSKALGILNTAGGFALALGPLIGGIAMDFLNWRWTFFINIPIPFLGFLLTFFFVKETRPLKEKQPLSLFERLDVPGGIFLMLTIGLFLLGLVQSNVWSLPIILSLFAVSALFFLLLLFYEKQAKAPILHRPLFQEKSFIVPAIFIFCMVAILWAEMFLTPLFAQEVHHLSIVKTGFLMLCFTIPVALFSSLSGYLYEKIKPHIQISGGFLLLILGSCLQIYFTPESSYSFMIFATLLLGFGLTFIWTPTLTLGLSRVSKEISGIASGTLISIQQIGGSIGLGLVGTLLRSKAHFLPGFYSAVEAIIVIACLGFCSTFFLPSKD